MAHYKVYTTYENDDGSLAVSGAAYTAVPGGNNTVGVPWTTAIVGFVTFKGRRFGGQALQASSPVSQAIQDELNAGTLFEWRWHVTVPAAATNPEAVALIEAEVNAQEAVMVTDLSDTLRYWGFEGDS